MLPLSYRMELCSSVTDFSLRKRFLADITVARRHAPFCERRVYFYWDVSLFCNLPVLDVR
jgi:hypothetical protein